MSVKTYSLARDGEVMLSKDFCVREFACNDKIDTILIDGDLITLLQNVRDHFGVPVEIYSGYRTPSYNKGASRSQHMAGTAADIKIPGVRPREIAKYAMTLQGAMGVGLYEYGSGTQGFCHIDTGAGDVTIGVPKRTKPTRWYQDNPNGPEKAMPNLGGSTGATTTQPTLRRGDKGDAVRLLQTQIKAQGFDPGTVDGVFGVKTDAAVRAFQGKKGLVTDGIVGAKTWAALV